MGLSRDTIARSRELCLRLHRPKTLDEVRQVTEAFVAHYNWQRPHQGISCGNRPPRVAFPTLPTLPRVPDLVNPDAWLSRVTGQHLVRRVNRKPICEGRSVSLLPLKQASRPESDLIHSGQRAAFAGGLSPGVSSLPAAQGPAAAGTALSGVCRTHAARSLDSTAFTGFRKVESSP